MVKTSGIWTKNSGSESGRILDSNPRPADPGTVTDATLCSELFAGQSWPLSNNEHIAKSVLIGVRRSLEKWLLMMLYLLLMRHAKWVYSSLKLKVDIFVERAFFLLFHISKEREWNILNAIRIVHCQWCQNLFIVSRNLFWRLSEWTKLVVSWEWGCKHRI